MAGIGIISVLITSLIVVYAHDYSDDLVFKGLSSLFSGEECEFTCPTGRVKVPRPFHVPSSNGCGVEGMKLDVANENFNFSPCCDEHDICFDTCNSDKASCDGKFKQCMSKICTQSSEKSIKESCEQAMNLFYMGTASLGCSAFQESQKNACNCEKDIL